MIGYPHTKNKEILIVNIIYPRTNLNMYNLNNLKLLITVE